MQLAQRMSVAEYGAAEGRSDVKYEYVGGEVYAMSGASRRHQRLIGNLFKHAERSAAGYCEIFTSGMDLWIAVGGVYYCPDVMGCCNPEDDGDSYVTEPCFIAEILSPSTSHIDRREKLSAYRTLRGLDEYIVIDQRRMHVTVHQRADGLWSTHTLREPDDILELTCIGMRLPLRDLYDRVKLPPLEVRDPSDMPFYVTAA
jgi:Uma2 family endonuclease